MLCGHALAACAAWQDHLQHRLKTPSVSEVLRLGLRLQTSPTQSMLTTPYKALDDAQPETATTADPSYAPTAWSSALYLDAHVMDVVSDEVEKLRLRQLLRSVVLAGISVYSRFIYQHLVTSRRSVMFVYLL